MARTEQLKIAILGWLSENVDSKDHSAEVFYDFLKILDGVIKEPLNA